MKQYLVDSSFLIALFLRNDVHHEKALSIFHNFKYEETKIIVCQRIIEETATVLTYKNRKDGADKFIDFIQEDIRFEIAINHHTPELDFYKNSIRKNISFIDAMLIYKAGIKNIDLLSFDKELLKIAKDFTAL